MMKQINSSLISKDMKLKQQLIVWIIITLIVFFVVIFPIIFFSKDFINACIESTVLLLMIGVPIGYRWGIKKILVILELLNSIKHDGYIAEKKQIVDKKKYVEDETYYKIFFTKGNNVEEYEEVIVDYSVYSKSNIGDEYILIFEKKNINFLKMYSTKDYYL